MRQSGPSSRANLLFGLVLVCVGCSDDASGGGDASSEGVTSAGETTVGEPTSTSGVVTTGVSGSTAATTTQGEGSTAAAESDGSSGSETTAAEPACDDATLNGDETDIDCGGSCEPCADRASCRAPADCSSGVCVRGVCAPRTCGDGVVQEAAGETCDDGGESARCDVDCTASECGDGVANMLAGEVCDDGGESATCNADCSAASCGDGIVNAMAGEDCDDTGESKSCDADCTTAECGDGVLNETAGEECDAGDVVDETCSDTCQEVIVCQGGASLLAESPGGDAVVCDDPTDTTCEQDAETLCPANWHLCSYEEFLARNDGWAYPVGPGNATVVGEIYCRASSGAGHFTVGPYDSPTTLGDDISRNCGFGSSRPDSCSATFGCNETTVQALCCAPLETCGNGLLDPQETCDDGNLDETDDCLNSCAFRVPSANGQSGC